MTSGRIIRYRISRTELATMAEEQFGDWIKAVVDVSREVMAVGGDLHADDEAVLLADGSRQRDLWGITGWRGHRCQEILRAREEICRLFFDPHVPPDSARGIRRYFPGFAWAARALHHRRQAGDHRFEGRAGPGE